MVGLIMPTSAQEQRAVLAETATPTTSESLVASVKPTVNPMPSGAR